MATSSKTQNLPDSVQQYKLYGSSSGAGSSLDVNDDAWMVVSQQSNPETDPVAYRVNLKNPELPDTPIPSRARASGIVLRPKDGSSQSNNSSSFNNLEAVATDLSKSVSGYSLQSEDTDSVHSKLFNNVLADLETHGKNNDTESYRQFEEMSMSHVGEALVSLHLCDETLASLGKMGVYYDSHAVSEVGSECGDDSSISFWDKVSHYVMNFLAVPTTKTFRSLQKYLQDTFDDLKPMLQSPKFQVSVLLACISIVVTAKLMDKKRMRSPIPIVNKCIAGVIDNRYGVVSQETFEQVFKAVSKK